jgi:hypothetical protein
MNKSFFFKHFPLFFLYLIFLYYAVVSSGCSFLYNEAETAMKTGKKVDEKWLGKCDE